MKPHHYAIKMGTDNDGVTTITFFETAQNTLSSALLAKLAEVIKDQAKDPSTKVIVLKSEGERTFCAGANFDELMAIRDEKGGTKFFSGVADLLNTCRKAKKIIIARVQGKAVGGGVGLAAVADYCMATEAASIKLSELSIGIGPFVIAPAVIRKIGPSAFAELSLRAGDFKTAQWAKEKGLYNEIYPDAASLDVAIAELAKKLSAYNPKALTGLKHSLWENTPDWDKLLYKRAAMSGKMVLSKYAQEALTGLKGER